MLTFAELWERLLVGDESALIEAKRGEKIGGSMLETVSAFANEPGRGGGYLLLGVQRSSDALDFFTEGVPPYRAVGVPDPDQVQADLATQCRSQFNVPVRPQIVVERVNGNPVVVAFIPEAQPYDKPVYIRSRGLERGAFRRIGSTDQHCTDDDVALFYQLRTHRTFDETVVLEADLSDLDPEAVEEYRRVRRTINANATELRYPDEELLYALAAVTRQNGTVVPTIAGLTLFGTAPALRRHFPMARVDYIRVPGREWVPDPENRYQAVDLRGPLMTLIPRVINAVLDDIPSAFALREDGIHRQDVPLVPRTVIREAIVNALMHRSYRQRQPVQIIALREPDRDPESGTLSGSGRTARRAGLARPERKDCGRAARGGSGRDKGYRNPHDA